MTTSLSHALIPSRVSKNLAKSLSSPCQTNTDIVARYHRQQAPGYRSVNYPLTSAQAAICRHHLAWSDPGPLEGIRSAMLEARRQRANDLPQFELWLKREAFRLEEIGF